VGLAGATGLTPSASAADAVPGSALACERGGTEIGPLIEGLRDLVHPEARGVCLARLADSPLPAARSEVTGYLERHGLQRTGNGELRVDPAVLEALDHARALRPLTVPLLRRADAAGARDTRWLFRRACRADGGPSDPALHEVCQDITDVFDRADRARHRGKLLRSALEIGGAGAVVAVAAAGREGAAGRLAATGASAAGGAVLGYASGALMAGLLSHPQAPEAACFCARYGAAAVGAAAGALLGAQQSRAPGASRPVVALVGVAPLVVYSLTRLWATWDD
jgi:hypothetical protein